MSNRLADQIDDLFTLGEDIADGAHAHEGPLPMIPLKQNMEADIRTDLGLAVTAQATYKAALTAKVPLSTAVTVADSNAKAFLSQGRRILVSSLGESWSQVWEATGFPDNSTAVPGTQAKRQALLLSLKNYLAANPGLEVSTGAIVFTSNQADTLFITLSNARAAAAQGNTVAGQKRVLRNAAERTLRKRLSGLIAELGQLLEDDDPRWLAFGLNLPGATDLPDQADSLVLTAGGPGEVHSDWGDAARATHYRVFKQIVGVDPAMVFVHNPGDSDYTFTGLPSGATVRVEVVSANTTGYAQPSAVVEIVVP